MFGTLSRRKNGKILGKSEHAYQMYGFTRRISYTILLNVKTLRSKDDPMNSGFNEVGS